MLVNGLRTHVERRLHCIALHAHRHSHAHTYTHRRSLGWHALREERNDAVRAVCEVEMFATPVLLHKLVNDRPRVVETLECLRQRRVA